MVVVCSIPSPVLLLVKACACQRRRSATCFCSCVERLPNCTRRRRRSPIATSKYVRGRKCVRLVAVSRCHVRVAVQPENVMVSDDGELLLTDFGSVTTADVVISKRFDALVLQEHAAQQSSMAYRAPGEFLRVHWV